VDISLHVPDLVPGLVDLKPPFPGHLNRKLVDMIVLMEVLLLALPRLHELNLLLSFTARLHNTLNLLVSPLQYHCLVQGLLSAIVILVLIIVFFELDLKLEADKGAVGHRQSEHLKVVTVG